MMIIAPLLLIIFQYTKPFITRFLRLFQNGTPSKAALSKAEGELHLQVWSGDYFHPVWTSGELCQLPLPRLLLSELLISPLQNAEQRSSLRMNGIKNKTSFMKSEVHDCQVDQSHRNFDTLHPTRRLWLVDTESRLTADLYRSGFKVQNKRSICYIKACLI